MPRIRYPYVSPLNALVDAIRDRAAATTPEEKRRAALAYEVAAVRYANERRARESAAVCAPTTGTCETRPAQPRGASEAAAATTSTTPESAVTDPKSFSDLAIAAKNSTTSNGDLSRRPVTAARRARSGGA